MQILDFQQNYADTFGLCKYFSIMRLYAFMHLFFSEKFNYQIVYPSNDK